jgi:glycosyltransferase involved in cell wall biosynthesis
VDTRKVIRALLLRQHSMRILATGIEKKLGVYTIERRGVLCGRSLPGARMSTRRQLDPTSVSVVIPARNAESTIVRAVRSVLAQTRPADEIIVVDDGSTDGTAAAALSCGPVRVIGLGKGRGAGGARNVGVRASGSAWTAFLDADDEWLPEKLGRQVAHIEPNGDQSVIFCASEEFASNGSFLGNTFRNGEPNCSKTAWKELLKRNFIATPTVMVPRDLFLRLGGFDATLPVAEDQDLWIRLALAGRLTYVPEVLVRIYVQPAGLSKYRPDDQARHVIPMIERHLAQLSERLTPAEARDVLGARLANAGRIAFANDDPANGTAFMLRAISAGHRPLAGAGVMLKFPLKALARRTLGRQSASQR